MEVSRQLDEAADKSIKGDPLEISAELGRLHEALDRAIQEREQAHERVKGLEARLVVQESMLITLARQRAAARETDKQTSDVTPKSEVEQEVADELGESD